MRLLAVISLFLLILGPGGSRMRAQSQTQQPPTSAEPAKPEPLDPEPHHHLMYVTPDIQIYDVLIPPHQSALMYARSLNYISIVLDKSKLRFDSPGQATRSVDLREGAVRFVEGGAGYTVTNDENRPYHALSIEFINSALTASGCPCNGGATDAICDCPHAAPLPPNWSLRIGHVLLRGVTLAPGATYDNDSQDTTRFLVAITPFDAMDNTIHEPKNLEVRLPAGRYHWLGPGPHEIQNLESKPLRFVCVQFVGHPFANPL